MIRRVQCDICCTTHALLPSGIVPYSQVPLAEHAAIAASFENGGRGMEVMEADPELSPSQVFYILSLYIRFWRQRLRDLSKCCFDGTGILSVSHKAAGAAAGALQLTYLDGIHGIIIKLL